MGSDETRLIRIEKTSEGERLDSFLSRKFHCSRSALLKRTEGTIRDDTGKPLKWSHRLRNGEVLVVPHKRNPEPAVTVDFDILHQDDWLVAVNKGYGAPVHPSRSFRTRTILTVLKDRLGDADLKPAHRIDRETSGVLIFGRGTKAVRNLFAQFAAGRVRKRYLAVVRGSPPFDKTRVELPLALDPTFPVRCRMRVDEKDGKKAVTEFEVLKRLGDRSLVSAAPRTGRQHQIRVHLAAIGFPILGDKLYQENGRPYLAQIGDKLDPETFSRLGHHRQALHAERLEFLHPESGDPMLLTAPLPEDLEQLIELQIPK
jgi:23S rRNA pseudouridine1911/1915/1917 synthase